MQFAANTQQRYFCRRKIDVFVHICCVYAQNKVAFCSFPIFMVSTLILAFIPGFLHFIIKVVAMNFISVRKFCPGQIWAICFDIVFLCVIKSFGLIFLHFNFSPDESFINLKSFDVLV